MCTESKIQNLKNIALDEMRCYYSQDEIEQGFDEAIEKLRNLDFSQFQDKEEAKDKLFEKLEVPIEIVVLSKLNQVAFKDASFEERFRNGLRLVKRFFQIKEKQRLGHWEESDETCNL